MNRLEVWMLWLIASALGAPPGLVMMGDGSPKALAKAQKVTMLPTMEKIDAGELALGEYLGTWGDFCALKVSEEDQARLDALHADRPELWVSRNAEVGFGLWKYDPSKKELLRHEDSAGMEPQAADVVVLEFEGSAPEAPKKVLKDLGHTDVKARTAPGTGGVAKRLMEQPLECVPSIGKDELTQIDALAQDGRTLYVVVVPGKGDPIVWRWDIALNGLRRI